LASTSTTERAGPERFRLSLGTHWIVELVGCRADRIATVDAVKPALVRAVTESRATAIHYEWHQFEPQGMSATVLIEESHFCLHTWPEHNYLALDIFTCGDMDAQRAIEILARDLEATETTVTLLERGIPA
jgi:S-adenosylmethionine decarboxylase proenzyme